jgi:hypothetical protein
MIYEYLKEELQGHLSGRIFMLFTKDETDYAEQLKRLETEYNKINNIIM